MFSLYDLNIMSLIVSLYNDFSLIDLVESYFYEWQIVGSVFFGLALMFKRSVLRVDFGAISTFIGVLIMFGALQISTTPMAVHVPSTDNNPLYRFLFVFLEDAYFVLPFIILKGKIPKSVWLASFGFVIAFFASGHTYWGDYFYLSGLYPVISYYFGKKHGLGTVMVCHVLYDMSVFLTSAIINVIIKG